VPNVKNALKMAHSACSADEKGGGGKKGAGVWMDRNEIEHEERRGRRMYLGRWGMVLNMKND